MNRVQCQSCGAEGYVGQKCEYCGEFIDIPQNISISDIFLPNDTTCSLEEFENRLAEFDKVEDFEDGFAIVHHKDKGYNCIDKNGRILLKKYYDSIKRKKIQKYPKTEYTIDKFILLYNDKFSRYGLLDYSFNEVVPMQCKYISFGNRLPSRSIAYMINDKITYWDLVTNQKHIETHNDIDNKEKFNLRASPYRDTAIYNYYLACHSSKTYYRRKDNASRFCSLVRDVKKNSGLPFLIGSNMQEECVSQMRYHINPLTMYAVGFKDCENLWETLYVGKWSDEKKEILNPEVINISPNTLHNDTIIDLCNGFKLEAKIIGLNIGLTLIDDRILKEPSNSEERKGTPNITNKNKRTQNSLSIKHIIIIVILGTLLGLLLS